MIRHFKTTKAKRRIRTYKKIRGTTERPRISVYRSQFQMYAQIIDDVKRVTILGMSDRELAKEEKNKIKRAQLLGSKLGEAAKSKNITLVVFDRSGYTYHGRVKALAQGLREAGLQF